MPSQIIVFIYVCVLIQGITVGCIFGTVELMCVSVGSSETLRL